MRPALYVVLVTLLTFMRVDQVVAETPAGEGSRPWYYSGIAECDALFELNEMCAAKGGEKYKEYFANDTRKQMGSARLPYNKIYGDSSSHAKRAAKWCSDVMSMRQSPEAKCFGLGFYPEP